MKSSHRLRPGNDAYNLGGIYQAKQSYPNYKITAAKPNKDPKYPNASISKENLIKLSKQIQVRKNPQSTSGRDFAFKKSYDDINKGKFSFLKPSYSQIPWQNNVQL